MTFRKLEKKKSICNLQNRTNGFTGFALVNGNHPVPKTATTESDVEGLG